MPSKHSQTSRVAPNYTYGLHFNVPRYWPISYIHHITLRFVKSDDLIHMHHNHDCFTDKMYRVNWHRICTVSTWTREFEPTTPFTLPLGIIYGSCRTRSSNLILLMKILIYGILIQVNWQIKVNGIFSYVNTLRLRQNDRHFADDVFKYIFLNENISILIRISLKFLPMGLIENKWALVQVITWRRSGNTPLSEPKLTQLTDAYMRH